MANGVHKYVLDLVGTLFMSRIIAVVFNNNWEQLTRNDGKTGIYFTQVFDKIFENV